MLFFNIAAPTVLVVALVLRYVAEYVWSDRRTKKNRRVRKFLLFVEIAAGLATIGVVLLSHQKSLLDDENLRMMKAKAEEESIRAEERHLADLESTAQLQETVESLEDSLTKFSSLASQRYPNKEPEEALQALAEDFRELSERTRVLEHRIRSLSAEYELTLDDGSRSGPSEGPIVPVVLPSEPYLKCSSGDEGLAPQIDFVPTFLQKTRLESGIWKVEVAAEVPSGRWPLGQEEGLLDEYDKCTFAVAMVTQRDLRSPTVTLRRMDWRISVNGVLTQRRVFTKEHSFALLEKGVKGIEIVAEDLLSSSENTELSH